MGFFKPATPGTILVLVAAILLVLVTLSTPIIKGIYFLQADIGTAGTATFGTLGYCIGGTCTPAKLGYDLNANSVFGISTLVPSKYSDALIKGLTYALIVNAVAAVFAVVAVVLGIFAHCCEFAFGCLGGCVTGLGAAITLIAFGLDLALFVIAKKRIDAIDGTSSTLGAALWMTVAAFALMSLAACTFTCGACAGGGGGSSRRRRKSKDNSDGAYGQRSGDWYGERMRMDAIEAERDRNRRQNEYNRNNEALPKFAEYVTEHEVPLKEDFDDGSHIAGGPGIAGAGAHAQGYSNGGYGHEYGQHSEYDQQYGHALNAAPAAVGAAGGVAMGGYHSDPHYAVASNNVPGVGEGYGRRQPTQQSATGYVDPYYTPGHGPQPFREGSLSVDHSGMQQQHSLAAPQAHYAAGPQYVAEPGEYDYEYEGGGAGAGGVAPARYEGALNRAPSAYTTGSGPVRVPSSQSQHQYMGQYAGRSTYASPPPMPHPAVGSAQAGYGGGGSGQGTSPISPLTTLPPFSLAGSAAAHNTGIPYHATGAREPTDHAARTAADDFGLGAIASPPPMEGYGHAVGAPSQEYASYGHQQANSSMGGSAAYHHHPAHEQSYSNYVDAQDAHDHSAPPPGYSSTGHPSYDPKR